MKTVQLRATPRNSVVKENLFSRYFSNESEIPIQSVNYHKIILDLLHKSIIFLLLTELLIVMPYHDMALTLR